MNTVRAYVRHYSITLLNAVVIAIVYVVGIAARPHASIATTARISEWFGIQPEILLLLFVVSVMAMASPLYAAKYLALIVPGLYAAAAFGSVWGDQTLTVVAGFQHGAMVLMMLGGIRMEQTKHDE